MEVIAVLVTMFLCGMVFGAILAIWLYEWLMGQDDEES